MPMNTNNDAGLACTDDRHRTAPEEGFLLPIFMLSIGLLECGLQALYWLIGLLAPHLGEGRTLYLDLVWLLFRGCRPRPRPLHERLLFFFPLSLLGCMATSFLFVAG